MGQALPLLPLAAQPERVWWALKSASELQTVSAPAALVLGQGPQKPSLCARSWTQAFHTYGKSMHSQASPRRILHKACNPLTRNEKTIIHFPHAGKDDHRESRNHKRCLPQAFSMDCRPERSEGSRRYFDRKLQIAGTSATILLRGVGPRHLDKRRLRSCRCESTSAMRFFQNALSK